MSFLPICLLIVVTNSTPYDKLTINTKLGYIIGNINTDHTAEAVYEFLGIPYAVPPINNLRFRPAEINTSWNGTYNATKYGPMCMQPYSPNFEMSEDCLYLNIWTPQIDKNNLLPVMLWIHGGSMITGAGSDASYNATNFVKNGKNVVVVTINYRLGPLGLLASKQLYDEDPNWKSYGGMNSVYDQIQAINWVKRYISDFGGNPDQITIFGESAGGESICYILISPIVAPDLFQRAIIESGACIGPWGGIDTEAGLKSTAEKLDAAGMSKNISVLRTYPASMFKFGTWSTSVDQLVLTELPNTAYSTLNSKDVAFNAKELIMGYNSMDGIVEGITPKNPIEYTEHINRFVHNKTQADLIGNYYYPLSDYPAYDGDSSSYLAWSTINGDLCVACPTIRTMTEIAKQKPNNIKTYIYEFRGPSPYYAYHSSEIPFVYDHPEHGFVQWNQTLSDAMVSAWSNYGKYGFPNITTNGNDIEWESTTSTNGNVMIFDDNIRVEANYTSKFRHGACDFWYDEVGYPTMAEICCYLCMYE